MANPIWETSSDLGTYNNNTEININLVAVPVPPAVGVTYRVVNGSLPPGTVFVNGILSGILTTTYTNNQMNFTVQATDNLGNVSTRTFIITVVIVAAQPNWITTAGSIGTFPAGTPLSVQLQAAAVPPATNISYALISGSLPAGIQLTSSGLLYGTPTTVSKEVSSNFVIRATDNLQNLRDRSFSISISGSAVPTFTSSGLLLSTLDSLWIDLPVTYNNPIPSNPVLISLKQGSLPPGLEINDAGVIRGYPKPPINEVTLSQISTSTTQISSTGNLITCLSTNGFTVGRQVIFSGTTFSNIVAGTVYYVQSVPSSTTFTISSTQFGPPISLTSGTGFMQVMLSSISSGQPTIRTYNFTLQLTSLNGSSSASYSITVINQNTPVNQGGPGSQYRYPVIFNTHPPTYNISPSDPYYGYYLPVASPSVPVSIGKFQSGNYFAFKVIGNDFDGNAIAYSYVGLPQGLTGDPLTGWITGTPTLSSKSLSVFPFSVAVYKTNIPSFISAYYNFEMTIANDINGTITWNTDSDLGSIYNSVISTLYVNATSDVDLQYRIVGGALPPNLELLSNGQITGYVADQPASTLLSVGNTSDYTFTVQAYSTSYAAITSTKTFTLNVLQEFGQPTDTLYMKCTPSISDRLKIDSLLNDEAIIPSSLLYRPEDQYFGKATSVIYEHAYGIHASDLDQYNLAVERNHYWRNLTLGQLNTAVAKDAAGNIIYEVVYSQVIDDLTKQTLGTTIAPLMTPGQTYTIVYPGSTDFTTAGAPNSDRGTVFVATGQANGTGTVSFVTKTTSISSQIYWPYAIDLQLGPWYTSSTDIFTSYIDIQNQLYYTSLTPGYARTLYPNSLPNMRNRVGQVLGQEYNSKLLPLWMTSQQADGSTTGFVPAWVICYTLPGQSTTVKNNIESMWPYQLNQINFKIDRFSVDKSNTYNYDNTFNPPAWTDLPSATPTPTPLDSKDFYVLFPRQTILPDQTQY